MNSLHPILDIWSIFCNFCAVHSDLTCDPCLTSAPPPPPETERLWTELADRQADLQCALSAHRSALSAVSEAGEPGPALAELAAHVQTHPSERAQQMQQRLQQIAQQLTATLTPEAAQQLTKQAGGPRGWVDSRATFSSELRKSDSGLFMLHA